ncbi:MAG TPA: hypothetical protein VJU61_25555 [Polyangiaceae bacterium]|nr:hypothetical protein [Polyangiaceae bacterium]
MVERQAIVGRLDAVRVAGRRLAPWLYRAALLALALWACQKCVRSVWPFTIDDSGISYAYAKHIAEGRGPVAVVGGPWVEGYSNPSWVFLLVPFHWLGLALPSVAKVLGVLLFAATAILSASLLPASGGSRWHSWGALQISLAIAMASCLEIVVWVVAGLENSLFWALLVGLAYLNERESRGVSARGLSGLCAFGLCITRPEGALYIAPWLALQLWQFARQPEKRHAAARALVLCLTPLLLYHALHYLTFREFVPNTFLAKPSKPELGDGYDYLKTNLQGSALSYALPLALLGLVGKPRLKLLLGWYCAAGLVFILYAGGDWMPYGRFLSLFAPTLLLLTAAGVDNACRGVVWVARQRLPKELLSVALGGALLWSWWQHQAPRLRDLVRRPWCHFCERLADTQAVLRLSQEARIVHPSLLTQDFGGPAWLSSEQFYPLDFLGLCDRNVALLRQDLVARHKRIGTDFRFYQYLFHEQATAPSWIYVPPNFWPWFERSPEYRWDYFRLDSRLLPHGRRDAYFALHRGELIDYFPPMRRAEFRPLTRVLTLVGSSFALEPAAAAQDTEAKLAPGARVRALLSIVRREKLTGNERLELRIDAGEEQALSGPVLLTRGQDLAWQIGSGEPLSEAFSLTLPKTATDVYRVFLGISQAKAARAKRGGAAATGPTWVELDSLPAGAPLGAATRTLPRYPAALPAPAHPELRALRPAVTVAIEQRRSLGTAAASDPALVQRLLELGESLDASRQTGDAYLAYVWATQLDPRQWRTLSDAVYRLRATPTDDEHVMEIALLQQYYSSGTPGALAALVGFYLSRDRVDQARYFFEFRPPASAGVEPWPSLSAALDAASVAAPPAPEAVLAAVARDPLGGALDFETATLEGWEGDRATYLAGAQADHRDLAGLRGYHRRGILSSLGPSDGARGSLLSPAFVLEGRWLSLLVGGGARKSRVGVELMIDDTAVKSAQGNGSDFLYPTFWDVSEYQGKNARLRVFDQSKDAHVLVDRVLLWQ